MSLDPENPLLAEVLEALNPIGGPQLHKEAIRFANDIRDALTADKHVCAIEEAIASNAAEGSE